MALPTQAAAAPRRSPATDTGATEKQQTSRRKQRTEPRDVASQVASQALAQSPVFPESGSRERQLAAQAPLPAAVSHINAVASAALPLSPEKAASGELPHVPAFDSADEVQTAATATEQATTAQAAGTPSILQLAPPADSAQEPDSAVVSVPGHEGISGADSDAAAASTQRDTAEPAQVPESAAAAHAATTSALEEQPTGVLVATSDQTDAASVSQDAGAAQRAASPARPVDAELTADDGDATVAGTATIAVDAAVAAAGAPTAISSSVVVTGAADDRIDGTDIADEQARVVVSNSSSEADETTKTVQSDNAVDSSSDEKEETKKLKRDSRKTLAAKIVVGFTVLAAIGLIVWAAVMSYLRRSR